MTNIIFFFLLKIKIFNTLQNLKPILKCEIHFYNRSSLRYIYIHKEHHQNQYNKTLPIKNIITIYTQNSNIRLTFSYLTK